MRPDGPLLSARESPHALIMGVLNVTSDSFSDGGLFLHRQNARRQGERLMSSGARIVDVGAQSTRPGARNVPLKLEKDRVVRTLRDLRSPARKFHVILSVDTTRAAVARAALRCGAGMINDVSGGLEDPRMMPLVAESRCLYVIQHWRGRMPGASSTYPHGVIRDVLHELACRVTAARRAGVDERQIILDPGLGFSKPGPQPNFTILRHLERLTRLGYPVLIGASRKRFLSLFLGIPPVRARRRQEGARASTLRADEATAVISALAALKGVWAVRVHDPATSRDALRVAAGLGARPVVGDNREWKTVLSAR